MSRFRDHEGPARRSGEAAKAVDRRREERVSETEMRARVRPGQRLTIIDVSAGGALVEAGRPLRPGSTVDVHLETAARRATVAARIVRCAVAAIDRESGITYRAALSFTETSDWVREVLTPTVHVVPGVVHGVSAPAAVGGDEIPVERDEGPQIQSREARND